MILDEKIAAGDIIVLDGATGTEIARLGGKMNSAAWCAVANKTHPDVVRKVHEEYLLAGADVITTNTFATCRHVLDGAGLADETVAINRRAVELAREARDNVASDRPVAVAGSLSNMKAWVAGSISSDPRHYPSAEQEAANYIEMANTLADAGADLLILEMMGDIDHASSVMEAAVATGLPVWVGISATRHDDGKITGWDVKEEQPDDIVDGHVERVPPSLAEIIDALMTIGGDVYGIMHSAIETTTPALDVLFERWNGPVMAYPETLIFDAASHRASVTVSAEGFADACRGWVEGGVQIIGGCCGTTIEHIRAMVDRLPAAVGPRRAA